MSTTPTSKVSPAAGGSPDVKQRTGLVLAVIVISQLMIILDTTVVTIALPDIQESLDLSATSGSWLINAYTLTFGGLLLLGGRAGDILGRRQVFIAGIAIFTAASLLGGFAQNAGWLLACRALQGLGSALASPTALALIATNFEEGAPRNRAFGLYAAVSGAGTAIGLILGGLLTELVSWRWVLFINVPIGVLVLVGALSIRNSERIAGRFDLSGALASTAGVTGLVYGFIRISEEGWSDGVALGAIALGVVLLAVFVAIERKARQPITPLRLFANRNRASSYLIMLLLVASMLGMWFFLTQFLQEVLGFSPIKAGIAFLPLTVAILGFTQASTKLIARYTPKALIATGAAIMLVGMTWLTQISADSSYLSGVLGPMLLLGVGLGLLFVPATATAMSAVAPEDNGAASGLVNVMQQIGGSLGLAILVTVFGTATRNSAEHVPAGSTAEEAKKFVLSDAISTAFTAGVIFSAAVLLVALLAISTKKQQAAPDEVAGAAA
ncbi:MFS transporter [Streptomyces scopuliridis]|uniref:MFS transporter n=1 Tax=Streptomyces scopuliridis TaxID=452529 RepID=UPI002DDB5A19|nr:MFS transporter [Streptomyces scopuliridis]WSB32671.1 MFS transporter [Streptomyces scopuliridis]